MKRKFNNLLNYNPWLTMSVEKCPLPILSCISHRIIKILSSCKHRCKIWFCLCLYNFLSMMVKGNAFNINFFWCYVEYPSRKFIVGMYVGTSCSHISWSKNNDALIVLLNTFRFLVTLGSCRKRSPLNENALVCTPLKNRIPGITTTTS
jgi:hypothetical protein